MKIHEYQAKKLLAQYGVAVPAGDVAADVAAAEAVAARIGAPPFVVKAQVHAGGRGKGGGIAVARDLKELAAHAGRILGMRLKTPQTGPEGKLVRRVLIEQGQDIRRELYVGILIDRAHTRLLVMASGEGGMDIEEVARTKPDAILREHVDPLLGLRPFQARRLALRLGLGDGLLGPATALFTGLFRAFKDLDASLVEVNPLIVTGDGRLVALDAKVTFDDNALHRHRDVLALRDLDEEDPLEVEASKFDLNYIKLEGEVGCMVNGAGLAMATMDIIKLAGSAPANFLDVGGGASVERIANAFRILTSDGDVRAVLVNIFGGIVRCDRVAEGIVQALRTVAVKVPVVVRLEGTNAAEAGEILGGSGLKFTVARSLADAAEKVIQSLGGEGLGMSVLVGKDTRVVVQGITGKEGSFHTRQCLEYGTRIVAGVTPGKGGQKVEGVPVFDTVADAVKAEGANVALIFVPPPYAADAVLEAADAAVPLVVCITEGIPVQDMLLVKRHLQAGGGDRTRLIGPNCPGVISPGAAKVGIMPGFVHREGRVGVISRSGTLTYEAVFQLTSLGLGQSTCIGVGGDPVIGSTFLDLLPLFEADPGTQGVVLIGEIGGSAEEEAAAYVKAHMKKPVVGFIAGRTAPRGRRMGHAGAIVDGGQGTAEGKIEALKAGSIQVADSPAEIGHTMALALRRRG